MTTIHSFFLVSVYRYFGLFFCSAHFYNLSSTSYQRFDFSLFTAGKDYHIQLRFGKSLPTVEFSLIN